jgi:uncharacterized protein YpmS
MKNKRILKQSIFILLGFIILALYIYTKRLESQKMEQPKVNDASSIVTETTDNTSVDAIAPPVDSKAPKNKDTGGIPAPKPAN